MKWFTALRYLGILQGAALDAEMYADDIIGADAFVKEADARGEGMQLLVEGLRPLTLTPQQVHITGNLTRQAAMFARKLKRKRR